MTYKTVRGFQVNINTLTHNVVWLNSSKQSITQNTQPHRRYALTLPNGWMVWVLGHFTHAGSDYIMPEISLLVRPMAWLKILFI